MAATRTPVTVGLAQINNGFSGQHYLPYSVGFLEAYARANAPEPGRYRFLEPLYKRIHRDECVARLAEADVAGFSIYVWNVNVSLAVARALKEARPERLIVCGGPHVPDRAEAFLRANPFIDVVVHGEGERPFLDILEAHPGGDWSGIAGISHLDGGGRFVHNPAAPRMRDLSDVPSPYLAGVFDPLIAAHPGEVWLCMWETNRGCPFSCTFCDWGSATASKVNAFDLGRARDELQWFAGHRIEFVFCCDANFGILPRDVEIARAAAACRAATGYPKALSVQNTKNATERAYLTQKILADSGLSKGVTISLQSTDAHTLRIIKRQNISVEGFIELQRRFTRDGVTTYTDFIIGLPGETVETFLNGVSDVIQTGQHNRIQFNNCSILPNAAMGDPAYIAEHGIETVETDIINMHGVRDEEIDGIRERQRLVIATRALPRDDWRRVRCYAWMAGLLHFDKVLQVPLLLLHHAAGLTFRRMFEAFLDVDAAAFPLLAGIRDFFEAEARSMQAGGPEFVYSGEWLGIYWPADEHAFIRLAREGRLDDFYAESAGLLVSLTDDAEVRDALADAIAYNRALLKQPFQRNDLRVDLDFDLPAFHRAALVGEKPELARRRVSYRVERSSETWSDWESWMREVVWYGHRKGAYLYGTSDMQRAVAGHY